MVSTREILYVLLISLAAGGGLFGGGDSIDGYASGSITAILPLLLLLLFSTDNPCGCGDGCGGTCPCPSPCCNNNRGRNNCPNNQF